MLLGSPRTLNVRNLVWHGFITTNDQGRLPLDAYGAMLITLTMTIATNAQRYFKASSTISLNIRYLNPKTFYFGDATTMTTLPISSKATTKTGLTTRRLDDICEFDPIYAQCAFGSTPIAQTNDSVELVSKLKDLIHSSSFVIPGTENQWNQSCQYLLPICQSVLDGQPSEEVDHTFSPFLFVISTLPLVEHALRLKYVDVNKCKKDRQFALIQGEYYLTMDVILDSAVPQEYFDPKSPADGDAEKDSDTVEIRNRLRGELGSGIMVSY
ncbi:hypothetical protein BGW38_008191 [Lunasporangiospora selenospora]|uniref:DUF4209 domain-containing protein n=1 Tax=Lunasporangiospora selenospora TaxID=979761 RepID=A0A9P6FXW9_9FUNG|nr:hypothetical protein BGW38_008191 [Lunasporangiospora selenospora]